MKIKMVLRGGRTEYREIDYLFSPGMCLDEKTSTLKSIAYSLFILEQMLNSNNEVSQISIPVESIPPRETADILEHFLFFLFNKQITVNFSEQRTQQRLFQNQCIFSLPAVCLFSGGLDSFTGIFFSSRTFPKIIGSFSSHSDMWGMKHKIKQLENDYLRPHGIKLRILDEAAHGTSLRKTRGLVYMVDGLLLGTKTLIVPECGTTMIQPKFTPFDQISLTTHPEVIAIFQNLTSKVLGFKPKIILPNSELTKSEIAGAFDNKEALKDTISCWSTRFCNSEKSHCGSCFGCSLRRIAFTNNRIYDNSYRYNIFQTEINSSKRLSNLLPLIRFSYDFLDSFEDMPEYSISNIIKYNKRALFGRMSLENLAALYNLKTAGRLRDPLLQRWAEKGIELVGKDRLDNRNAEIQEGRRKPQII